MPKYDRSALTSSILHVGVGNFHRAHQADHVDKVLQKAFDTNKQWGIIGGSLYAPNRPTAEKRKQLEDQDWMQTIVEQDGESEKAIVIGSMTDFLPVDEDNGSIQKTMMDPNIKIVSLTVTEGGYFLTEGKFDVNDPQIQYDIKNIDGTPKTVYGMLVKALKHRRDEGLEPLTVLSCDNLPHNGDVVRSVLLGIASEVDADLATWVKDNVACPNNMVDRITPRTTDENREHIKQKYGYEDSWPIFCEPFTQWVLEDSFPQGRPQLELLDSVTFVDDVSPYEFKKIRILNGGHASLCYPAALLDVEYVHEALEHPVIGPFLDALEYSEIIPTVGPVPNVSLPEYWTLVAKRFANPTIMDGIPRICFGGASNQPKFTIPVAEDNLKAGRGVDGIALVSAMWCRYCQGKTESGADIAPNDPQWDRLQETALKAADEPTAWLTELTDVYGEVGKHPEFASRFTKWMKIIQSQGVVSAMGEYTESTRKAEASPIRTALEESTMAAAIDEAKNPGGK